MRKIIGGILIVLGWVAYIGASGFGVYYVFSYGLEELLGHLEFGMASMWLFIGVFLWQATEWFDDEFF